MNIDDALRIVRDRHTVPTGYVTLGDAADALVIEVERLRTALAPFAAAEVEHLRSALAPFAAVGRTIPRDWPSACRLREDAEYRSSETGQARGKQGWHQWLAYWGVHDGGSLPTIVEWRAASEAVGTTKPSANP